MNALDLNTRIQRTRIIVWFERTKMMDGASLTSHTRLNHSMLFYWYARLCGRLQTEQRYTMCQSNRAYLNTQRAKESERRRQQHTTMWEKHRHNTMERSVSLATGVRASKHEWESTHSIYRIQNVLFVCIFYSQRF